MQIILMQHVVWAGQGGDRITYFEEFDFKMCKYFEQFLAL